MTATGRVMLSDVARDRLRTRPGVALQGADRSMARSDEKDGCIGAVFSGVRECGVSQLVKRPATSGFAEQLGGATV